MHMCIISILNNDTHALYVYCMINIHTSYMHVMQHIHMYCVCCVTCQYVLFLLHIAFMCVLCGMHMCIICV